MRNLTLLTDLYELTMMQGYFKTGNNRTVIFDAFHRNNPCGGGYAIACGLDQESIILKIFILPMMILLTLAALIFLIMIFLII